MQVSERDEDILSFDPFAGDYGGAGSNDGVLSDKLVKGRKTHKCHTCDGPIAVGERHRNRSEVYDGEFMSFRWCAACCKAMVSDDDDAYEQRVSIGDERRAAS